MANYEQVQSALESGIEPALICSTCPWDRNCIQPPEMTKADIDRKMQQHQDEQKRLLSDATRDNEGHGDASAFGSLLGTLMTSLAFAGKDTQATICPVLSVRMRSSSGRQIVDNIKSTMQSWNDNAV